MYLPGSYANGFAPRDAEPRYPQLWRGCVGAWCPSLGPTGATLRDWSGRANHGTLTSMTLSTAWNNDQGYDLKFVRASSQYVAIPSTIVEPTQNWSIEAWVKPASNPAAGQSDSIFSQGNSASGTQIFVFGTNPDGTVTSTFRNDASATVNLDSTVALVTGVWSHVAMTHHTTNGLLIYINGAMSGQTSSTLIGTFTINKSTIGALGRSITTSFWDGQIDDLSVDGITMPAALISKRYQLGRGAAFAMRDRLRTRSAAGGMLLQRRRLCA